jgi:hypothetical protein
MWESWFKSFPLDEPCLDAVIRYVERNPVKAHMVTKAEDYPTGRPLGSPSFVERIERLLHRSLKKQRPGPEKAIK